MTQVTQQNPSTATQPAAAAEPLEKPSHRATKSEAAAAIVQEIHCSRNYAFGMLQWLESIVRNTRHSGYQAHRLTRRQLRSRHYRTFKEVFQPGAVATAGSAADLVGEFLLDPARNEAALRHNRSGRGRTELFTVNVVIQAPS